MNPQGGARPGSRLGARAARDAGPHSCREPPVAAALGLMRDGTGSGSWLCRRGCTRAAGGPVLRAAAMMGPHAARPETAPPRPHTKRTAQAGCRAYRLARSAPFYHRIRIDAGDRAMLALAPHHAGVAPGAARLPAQAGRVQRAPDRERAHPGQSIWSLAQGSLQQAQRPRRRAVLLALGRAGPFSQNALLLVSPIADPWSTPMARPHSGEPVAVEAADPGGDGLVVPSSDLVGGPRVARAISNGQQRSGALALRGGRAGRAAQAGQRPALIRRERAEGICSVARHGTPRATRTAPPQYQILRHTTH